MPTSSVCTSRWPVGSSIAPASSPRFSFTQPLQGTLDPRPRRDSAPRRGRATVSACLEVATAGLGSRRPGDSTPRRRRRPPTPAAAAPARRRARAQRLGHARRASRSTSACVESICMRARAAAGASAVCPVLKRAAPCSQSARQSFRSRARRAFGELERSPGVAELRAQLADADQQVDRARVDADSAR